MPLFYFDLYDGDAPINDRFGIDLESVEEAAEQAAALLPDIARDVIPARGSRDLATFVRDQNGTVVHRAALLYRAESPPESGNLTLVHGDALDIITQSREARARARLLSAKLNANVSDLFDLLRQSQSTIEEARDSAPDRIVEHLK